LCISTFHSQIKLTPWQCALRKIKSALPALATMEFDPDPDAKRKSMSTLATLCKRPVHVVQPDTTVRAAAEIMREQHVGAVIVVASRSGRQKPIGIVTDRDIVVAVVALDLDPNVFLISDLLGRPLTVAGGESSLHAGLDIMQMNGIRRLPIVDRSGRLVGIVTLDDIMRALARDIGSVADVVEQEILSELALRPGHLTARPPKVARKARPKPAAAGPSAAKSAGA
jgi:CBS domain-containing protein